MANIKPIFASVELEDGTVFTDVRVILADRLALERTAKNRGWDIEKEPQKSAAFMTWAALVRRHDTELEFDAFLAAAVDVQLDDEKAAAEVDGDPTRPARFIEP